MTSQEKKEFVKLYRLVIILFPTAFLRKCSRVAKRSANQLFIQNINAFLSQFRPKKIQTTP
jgi:hypothetical protein